MDQTIRNASELQRALLDLNNPTTEYTNNPIAQHSSTVPQGQTNVQYTSQSSSKDRTNSDQYSSNKLLYNLGGLQTTTNSKVELLTDAVLRMHQTLENMHNEQKKQTELLSIIARNTIPNQTSTPITTRQNTSSKSNSLTVQQYGFTNARGIISELIIKLLKQVEIQMSAKGHRYRSTRVMEEAMMNRAVKIACDAEFKTLDGVKKPIKIPDNKNPMTLHVASRVGTVDGISPILNAETLRDLFDNTECRAFMSIVQDIMERLIVIGIVLPFYEADMIKAISFPYFDADGKVICDWNRIVQRNETTEEAAVMTTSITNREKIGTMIAKGVPLKSVLRAVIKDGDK